MSLPLTDVTFYRLPDASPTGATIAAFLDAVFTSLSSSVDYRGTTIPNTHKWTWTRYQTGSTTEAVYNTAVPTGSPMGMNPTILIAGNSTATGLTPVMISPDTSINSIPMIGIVKNPGAFSAWDATNPMTSGQFSGYSKISPVSANATTTAIRCFISQESLFLQILESNTSQYWAHVGAIIEPFSDYSETSYNAIPACESDDRMYAVSTTGVSAVLHPSFLSTTPTIYNHAAVNGQNHFVCFRPDSSDILSTLRRRLPTTGQYNIYEDRDLADKIIVEDFTLLRSSLYVLGKSRGVYAYGTARAGQMFLRSGNTDLFHILSSDVFNSTQAIALAAAP